MRCKKHPRYQGKRVPRLPCKSCWWVYFFGKHMDNHWVPDKDLNYGSYD